ncbi:MAG: hypothetical protein HY901_29540 [Deltaproteobacteria bacterium]|nr:hypothetical protein [Deltaproteobacteria bacterium]
MNRNTQALVLLLALGAASSVRADKVISNGELYVDGRRVFVKTAVPLRNFASDDFRSRADILIGKGYNNFKLNLYWVDYDGDGDGALEPNALVMLNELIGHIRAQGAFCALSFETYNVGGGGVPAPFFTAHPEAQAVNQHGQLAYDTYYATNKAIPSIFHPAYLSASRAFIKNVVRGVDPAKVLYYETTVEPQYVGGDWLDFSNAARDAYQQYCAANGLTYSWPPSTSNLQWNIFRARALAEWIDGDAQAIREVAGPSALVAVDFLEAGYSTPNPVNGDNATFLGHLNGASILQCNWHWNPYTATPFETAYDLANSLQPTKHWAISEHMTLNGSDFRGDDISALLQHTLSRGNRFGWEIVNTLNNTNDSFSVYNDDWSPKSEIATLDNNHAYWMSLGHGGQAEPYVGEFVSQSYPSQMVSGATYPVSIELQNLGTVTWGAGTRLGTTEPMDRLSPFADGSWLGANRAASVAGPTAVGEVARFAFTMTAPTVTQPTTFVEHFGLVEDGVQWFSRPALAQLWFSIEVVPDQPDAGAPGPDAAGPLTPDAEGEVPDAETAGPDAAGVEPDAAGTEPDGSEFAEPDARAPSARDVGSRDGALARADAAIAGLGGDSGLEVASGSGCACGPQGAASPFSMVSLILAGLWFLRGRAPRRATHHPGRDRSAAAT